MKQLLKAGADITARNDARKTALRVARDAGATHVVTVLKQARQAAAADE